jgi:hypothetical protein
MAEYAHRQPAPLQPVLNKAGNESAASESAVHLGAQLQRTSGDAGVIGVHPKARRMAWQAKLKVGSATDPAEAEADSAAREVVYSKGGGNVGPGVGGGVQAKPLVNRISRMIQREADDDNEAQGKLQREEDETASPRLQREEDDDASLKAQREEDDKADLKVQREEDDKADLKAQREEDDEADLKAQREEDDKADLKAQREEDDKADLKAQREEDDEADLKAQREEDDEADLKAQREEDDEADLKARREEDDKADLKARREEEELNKKDAPAPVNHREGFTASQETAQKVQDQKPMGEPLPAPLKGEMEAGFGADFSDVRIHRDSASAELNQDLKAKAFTTGEDVFFGEGQFDPGSLQGKELIAHELTHTIQQGAVKPMEGGPQTSTPAAGGPEGVAPSTEPASEDAGKKGDKPEGKKEGGKKEKKGEGEGTPAAPVASVGPEDDPAFQAVHDQVSEAAAGQRVHPDPKQKVAQVDAAAKLPAEDQEFANDAGAQMAGMDEENEKRKQEGFTAATFKEKLAANLKDLEKTLPTDEDSAEEFKEEDGIGQIKDNINKDVKQSQVDATSGLEGAAETATPPATGMPVEKAVPLKKDPTAKMPAGIDPAAAVPKPVRDEDVSMEKESEDIDVVMADNDITETQLEKSNEPKFQDGLEKKREAQAEAANAPAEYRKQEQEKLEGAKLLASQGTKAGFKGMLGANKAGIAGVNASQNAAKKTDEEMQAEVNARFEEIYNETKLKVDDTLTKLGEAVDAYFEKEAEEAKTQFETNVEEKISDIYGVTVIDDWLFGADTEAIEKVFVVEKDIFVGRMDRVLDKIAQGIADALNHTLDIIKDGRKKSKDYYDGLDKKQQDLAKESFEGYNDQYASLEDTVYEKEEEMAAGLADAYQENVDSLRESFETIRDTVAAGWIGAALAAIWGIIKTILKLFEMLAQLLSAVVEAIGAILEDPIGFLENLFNGVKKGLDNFIANIKTHLITGLVEWLTGSLGGVGITMPGNLFSLPGIFDLCGQILGLSWDYFRAKAVKKLGEPVVKGIEATVDIFIIIKNDGIMGLWGFVKDKFQDLQATVMDAIRDMIISKVVEAGIKWIISLMNPASAFVKAVMMIIDIARFFIERAADIIELVMAFIDGIRSLAAGNVDGVAKGIEKALAKSIPILLGFLASLLGITGLTGKVTKIIKKIRKKVDKFIGKLIQKAKRLFKKKGNKGKDGKKVEEEVKGLTPADHKKHKKYVEEIEKELKKPEKKKPATFDDFYAAKKKQMADLEKKYNGKLTKKVNGKPLKTTITMGALAAEKKDDDLDIKIKIAPNDAEGGG